MDEKTIAKAERQVKASELDACETADNEDEVADKTANDQDRDGVEVWVDGAVYNAGTRREVGACGVFVASSHPCNKGSFVHKVATPPFKLTNQYMELHAAHAGLEVAMNIMSNQVANAPPTVYTTSVHVINCMTKWVSIWERTGYITKNKRPVQHTDFIRSIRQLQNASGGQFVRILIEKNGGPSEHTTEPAPERESVHERNHRQAVLLASQAAADGGRIGCKKTPLGVMANKMLFPP